MCINKIEYILKNYWNKKNDIKFNIEYYIYKKFNDKLINFKWIFRYDINFFDKY